MHYSLFSRLFLTASFFVSTLAFAEYRLIDKVIAIVDESVITQSEFDEKIAMAKNNLAQHAANIELPSEEEIQTQVLNSLILEKIQMEMAKRAGIKINDDQLNQAMTSIAQKNGLGLAEFRDQLHNSGLDYNKLRDQVRNELTIQQVQQGNLQHRIQITEHEVANYLASAEGARLTATRYHAQHVLLTVDESATQAEEQKAKQALQQIRHQVLQNQLSFAELIQGKTVNGYAIRGQDFAWQSLEDLPSLFIEQTKTMEAGEISEPIRSGAGWHLLRLAEKTGGNHIVEQTHARHILIMPSEVRNEEQSLKLATQLYEKILQGDDFTLLAKEYSEDKGSALQGGDLGWTGPGQFVPEFEQTLHALAINDISRPIKSQFGWHIIQKLGERQHDLTQENWKMQARNAIFEKKFHDELEAWLAKIRDEVFVEIK